MFNNYEFRIKDILKKTNNLELAEELCLEAIKKFPKNIRYQNLMKEIKVTNIKQNSSNSFFILQNYIKNNEYKKGLDYALNLIEIYPDNVDLLNNIGSFYFHLGLYDESILFFEKVQSKDVKHHKSLNNLGRSFLKKSLSMQLSEHF